MILLLSNHLMWRIDSSFKSLIYHLGGKSLPDSNIVLITISQKDIEQLGGWPLKRSYYALLIDELSKFKIKNVGLEVFLSSSNSMQDIYDDVLIQEIKKSGNVVLSSEILTSESGKDSLLLPHPKMLFNGIKSGHINYFSDNGYIIQTCFIINNSKEYSFSSMLTSKIPDKEKMKINFTSSWQDFKQIPIIEFMKLTEEKNSLLLSLKNKYVIIGIIDPDLAKTINTSFDSELPGLALHAFALDNILNNKMIKQEFTLPLTLIIVVMLALLYLPRWTVHFNYRYLIFFVAISAAVLVLYKFMQIELYNSFWFVPLVLLYVYEWYIVYQNRIAELREREGENTGLKILLYTKETKLAELESKSAITSAQEKEELLKEISALKSEISELKSAENYEAYSDKDKDKVKIFEGIVYKSDKMHKLVSLLGKIAPHDATVLIEGESGSGKELIARAIHNLSGRKGKNFVALNCAAIPESLLESELFGHVKGAFTNAIADKIGKFESADGGTLFLDEISETSEAFQSKLLRTIQFGELYKVGSSSKAQKVNVRILAATNKDLEQVVKEKRFREDLFYRLNVLRIGVPPLRERKEDIAVLADYFCKLKSDKMKISQIVFNSLIKNEWRGNVRELESIITHSLIMAQADGRNVIILSDLPDDYRKYEKVEIEQLILNSLRSKNFSHSSLVETAKELGGLSRTLVSETQRGIFLKAFVDNNFIYEKAVAEITGSSDVTINQKVQNKLEVYIENIGSSIVNLRGKDFSEVKSHLSSKYKNLNPKFHPYLDSVILERMKNL
jgi:transcriptional regulator with GAF, ATPase, and Fis domain/CHASE2 domain-containing sensor protein